MSIMHEETSNRDLVDILKPYENQWVALSVDHTHVLGAGNTFEEADREAKKTGEEYVFLKLPPYDVVFIPSCL